MEHKVNDIIAYNHNGETVYLKVIESLDCENCFFYSNTCCSDIRNDIGDCLSIRRTDKTSIVFKKVNNKTMNENIDLHPTKCVVKETSEQILAMPDIEESNKVIDWEQRRYEIAKAMLSVIYHQSYLTLQETATDAVEYADALIRELKK